MTETEGRQDLQKRPEEANEAVEFAATAGRLSQELLQGELGAYDVAQILQGLEAELTRVEKTLAEVVREYNSLLFAYQGAFMDANLDAFADDDEASVQEADPELAAQRSLVNASFFSVGEFERRRHEVNQRRRVLLRYCEYLPLSQEASALVKEAVAGIDSESNSVLAQGGEDPLTKFMAEWDDQEPEAPEASASLEEALPAWEEACGLLRRAASPPQGPPTDKSAPRRPQEGACHD